MFAASLSSLWIFEHINIKHAIKVTFYITVNILDFVFFVL